MGVTEISCGFRLVLDGKTSKIIPELSILQFLEKFIAKHFALSDAEDNNSWPRNRGGTADLPLLRKLLAICQKSQSQVSGKWQTHVFLAYGSLAASKPFHNDF